MTVKFCKVNTVAQLSVAAGGADAGRVPARGRHDGRADAARPRLCGQMGTAGRWLRAGHLFQGPVRARAGISMHACRSPLVHAALILNAHACMTACAHDLICHVCLQRSPGGGAVHAAALAARGVAQRMCGVSIGNFQLFIDIVHVFLALCMYASYSACVAIVHVTVPSCNTRSAAPVS